MKNNLFLLTTLLLASSGAHAANLDAKAAFDRLRTLVGSWEATAEGSKMRVTYELIGGGTALVERDTADNMPTMETVFHLDGNKLMLTHYCMMGNQPRMQAQTYNAQTGELKFDFLDITNLATPGAGHMHHATLRLVDADHLSADWQFYENGHPKFTEAIQFVRVR